MADLHTDLMKRVLAKFGGRPNLRLYTNPVVSAWVGKVKEFTKGVLTLVGASKVHAGLEEGSPDIFGWRILIITPEMVGERIAQPVGLEVKIPPDDLSPIQQKFLMKMEMDGCVVGVVRKVEDVDRILSAPISTAASRRKATPPLYD